jgi:hypothetical protein
MLLRNSALRHGRENRRRWPLSRRLALAAQVALAICFQEARERQSKLMENLKRNP